MGTKIKNHTSLEQSKKLAEILPLESADMCYTNHCYGCIRSSMTASTKTIKEYKELLTRFADLTNIDVFYPCWSLTALLSVIPNYRLLSEHINCHTCTAETPFGQETVAWYDNPIDACYELILKLHEKKLLLVK